MILALSALAAQAEEQYFLLGSPLVDRLATLFAGGLLVVVLQRLVAVRERRRGDKRDRQAIVTESERSSALKLDDAIHQAHEHLRGQFWKGDPGQAIAQMADELDVQLRREAFTLTDPDVRDRVEALDALLGMCLTVEEVDEGLDETKAGYAIERAVVNARRSLVSYARGEPLPAPTFPARSEFPRIMWMVPRAQRWDTVYERLDELLRARAA